MAAFGVRSFFCGRATVEKLHRLGIQTIGKLAMADEGMINAHAAKVQENAGRPYQRKESLLRGISGGEEGDDRV